MTDHASDSDFDSGVDRLPTLRDAEIPLEDVAEVVETCLDDITGEGFASYRRHEKYADNIRDGHPEYNTGGGRDDPARISPHTLGQCQRKMYYREQNAPAERSSPDGIFAVGDFIESEYVEPWLRKVASGTPLYVQNDLYVEASVQHPAGDLSSLTIAGCTDPAFVTADGVPRIITEVKSKQDVGEETSASEHHQAQLTAYQYAAADQFDIEPPAGVLIYVGRKKLTATTIHLGFDQEFFHETVVPWCVEFSQHRLTQTLPAATPCQDWECSLCEFKQRCGEGTVSVEDLPPEGFVPGLSYPYGQVVAYLRCAENPVLTPTVASQYPELAEEVPVSNWECDYCDSSFAYDDVEWDSEALDAPSCPSCRVQGQYGVLKAVQPH